MKNRDLLDLSVLGGLWGGSFLFMRIAVPEMGPFATIGLRVVLAALVLLVLLSLRSGLRSLRPHAKPLLVVGVLNSALPFCLLAYALLSVSAGFGAILNATTALFSALLAWLWLRERTSAGQLVGLALGFTGVAVLAWGKVSFKPGGSGLAVLAGLGAAGSYSIAAVYARRRLNGVPSLTVATGSQVAASLVLVPFMVWAWPEQAVSLKAWLSVLMLAVGCTALAYILYFGLLARSGTQRAASVTYLVPVFAMLWGEVFLREHPTLQMVLGGLIVLLGVSLSNGWIGPGKRAE
jgi:drug/metabolite transporter (DMT)-like permease